MNNSSEHDSRTSSASHTSLAWRRNVLAILFVSLALSGCGDRSLSRTASDRGPASTASASAAGETSAVTKSECTHDAHTFRCVKYLKNYDADTITFSIPGVHPLIGEKISVRVNGIDAPELKTENDCEKKSARIARNLIENVLKRAQRIDLVNVDRDKYFRILADVSVDGRDLKEVLMRNGLAYEYHGGTKRKVDWCAVARGEGRVPAGDSAR